MLASLVGDCGPDVTVAGRNPSRPADWNLLHSSGAWVDPQQVRLPRALSAREVVAVPLADPEVTIGVRRLREQRAPAHRDPQLNSAHDRVEPDYLRRVVGGGPD